MTSSHPPIPREAAAVPADHRLQEALHRVQELEQELAEARGTAEARARLLADVSHELRTPLNAVLGMAGLLLDSGLQPEQRERASTILQAARGLLGLVGDLLDYARIESGRLAVDPRPLDLRAALEAALDLVAADAARAGLDLTLDVDPAVPDRVIVDGARLRQILANLLSNAVKYTPAGEVQVHVRSEAYEPGRHAVHFVVRDSGIGIAPDALERIFQPFAQASAEPDGATDGRSGIGLGLAISRQLATLLGGALWAESQPGQGSAFHLRLGLPLAGADQRPLLAGPQAAFQGRRVLVVDDNSNNRRILARLLEAWGAQVEGAADAYSALAVLAGTSFDLIVLDMQMPRVDGISLARTLRAMGRPEPMVLLSSLGTPEVAFQDLGFRAVLTKPVKSAQLCQTLAAILDGDGGEPIADGATPPGPRERGLTPPPGAEGPLADTALAIRLPRRILIVEDQPSNQQVLLQLLRRLGYLPELAADGVEALRLAQARPFDLLLIDLHIPGLGGLSLSRRLRQGGASAAAYLAAVTASAAEADRSAAREAGMDDFLAKPFEPADLESLIRRSAGREARSSGAAGPAQDLRAAAGEARPGRGPGAALSAGAAATDTAGAGADEAQPLAIARRLEQLFGGADPAALREILELYLSDCDQQVALIRALEPRRDGAELLRRVHALKGCHRNLGLTAFAERCARLEDLIAAAPPEPRLRQALADLATAYARLRAAVVDAYGPLLRGEAL